MFLVDSGSSSCFLNQSLAGRLSGRAPLPTPVRVQVAGGKVLHLKEFLLSLTWYVDGQDFTNNFRIISLNNYDGSVGHDWLAKLSPMITHWSQHWLAIVRDEKMIVLQGEGALEVTHALIELFLVQDYASTTTQHHNSVVQEILDEFLSVFATSVGLPPRG
jgi:hypothetical protein